MAVIVQQGKTLEDFLASDDLFVEYFNVFLSLPTFPEALLFNKDTGGFEVVSEAKKELAKKIKDAFRSQARIPRIYKVAKQHSYSNIPLISIETNKEPDSIQEIHTSFSVTTLNKEQGIHWIKAERLPAFLKSNLYLEYRLSKLLSQSRITGSQGEYVLMQIDFKPHIKKVKQKKSEDVVDTNPRELVMKQMYVCMGNVSATVTDAWYTTVKMATEQQVTYTSDSRPSSEVFRPLLSKRPTSARPSSAYINQYNISDSGIGSLGSSQKGSGKTTRNSSYSTLNQLKFTESEHEDDDILMSKLFTSNGKQLSRSVCQVSQDHSQRTRPFNSIVYSTPVVASDIHSQINDSELCITKDHEIDDERDSGKGDDEMAHINECINENQDLEAHVFNSVDDIGSVIVGVVLKRVLSTLHNEAETDVERYPEIQKLLPNSCYSNLTIESLDKFAWTVNANQNTLKETKDIENEQKVNERTQKDGTDESDVDSLLDSDEDYEEEDECFHKKKHKTYSLNSRKGISQFKKFLRGTLGELNWNLWIDIDRLHLMTKHNEIQQYLCYMRERYHNPGAEYELSREQKTMFGLVVPSAWTVDKLLEIHNSIAEPLVLYWSPRFLLKQMMRSNPDTNLLYYQLKHLQPPASVDPKPPTATLLPLRPKSCHPRIRTEIVPAHEQQCTWTAEDQLLDTSPTVGRRRTYMEPTLRFIADWQKKQMVHSQILSPSLHVERTSTPNVKRPVSAKQPGKGTKPLSSSSKSWLKSFSRPTSALSSSSRISIESSSERVTMKSPKSEPQMSATPRSRPLSAASNTTLERYDGGDSEVSEFLGGNRMEHLLKALHHENDSGGFFRTYVEETGNKLWIDNLNMWQDVQAYHALFYSKFMDPFVLQKKAKMIYSSYLVTGAPRHIGCSLQVTKDILSHLEPPFEELFDDAEEHTIRIIFEAWQEMCTVDKKTYHKVELIEVTRHLETKSKYVKTLQKRGVITDSVSTPDFMEGYQDPIFDEVLIANVPDEFKNYTLEQLVHNRIELEHFRNFLADNYASMDIMCWMDIEAFRRVPYTEEKQRDVKAKEIKTKYLNKKYFFGPNSPAGKEGQKQVIAVGGGMGILLDDRPPSPMILETQKYVRDRLEKKWLPLFLVTPEFAVRQKPCTSMDDVVNDVLVMKRKKSLNLMKLLDSKWITSSQEIIVFRKALLNPVTAVQFRRFVSIKGDSLENDVLFWSEVQKYKDMYHAHCDESLITQKINTIVNCFIESQIPPSLQIDIPAEMAEKVLERKHERSPYIFREAQLMVFRVLFPHWSQFCEFRLNLGEDRVLPTIERLRRHAKTKERKKLQGMEERIAKPSTKESERRAVLGLPPLEGDDDVFTAPFITGSVLQYEEEADDDVEQEDKEKISWTYSNYILALEKEELLNNTDESSFISLLTDTASVKTNESPKPSVDNDQSVEEKQGSKAVAASQTEISNFPVNGTVVKNGSRMSSVDKPSSTDNLKSHQNRKDGTQSQKAVTIVEPKPKSVLNEHNPKVKL